MPKTLAQITLNNDAINVLYASNKGAERVSCCCLE